MTDRRKALLKKQKSISGSVVEYAEVSLLLFMIEGEIKISSKAKVACKCRSLDGDLTFSVREKNATITKKHEEYFLSLNEGFNLITVVDRMFEPIPRVIDKLSFKIKDVLLVSIDGKTMHVRCEELPEEDILIISIS